MPLQKSTSKQAFQHNVKTEIAAGRPPRQAVAIAYATRRSAAHTEHHSDHSRRRSEHYHAHVARSTHVARGAMRMTRAQNDRTSTDSDTLMSRET